MNVLLTGATGFLGKRVLDLLVADPGISTIHVVSRRSRTHPSPKVRIHSFDLVAPWNTARFAPDFKQIDSIVHLAGLYDFSSSYGDNYQQNVLPTLNLIDWVRSRQNGHVPAILFASTYAVGAGVPGFMGEAPIDQLPPDHRPYAHTKAVAEKALTDSGLPARIFRLGVLVGDSSAGYFEKIDGPYALMRLLSQIRALPGSRFLKWVPIPANPQGILPLVPVDSAASVIHRSLRLPRPGENADIYGVYHPESAPIQDIAAGIFEELLPGARPLYLDRKDIAKRIAKLQQYFTRIPTELFRFALEPLELRCEAFQRTFGADAVPRFGEYREVFYNGFRQFGNPSGDIQ